VQNEASAAKVSVAVCGEMGGRTLEALALIGLGIDRLSVTPAAIGPLKAMIRSVNANDLREQMAEWLIKPGPNLRGKIENWATGAGIEV
jgi:phosphotransferase system, enzyme I, PtsP